MRGSTMITVALGLTALAGCGGSNPPPAASSAPAYKPPTANQPAGQPQAVTTEREPPKETGDKASQGQTSSLTTTEEMPAEEKDGLGDEAPSDEAPSKEEPAPTETTAEKETDEKQTPQKKTDAKEAVEEQASTETEAATAAEPSVPRRRSGQLLRRLGSSFGRALAKASTNVESPTPSRPAPSLADDPFPNGEPADEKTKE